MEKIAKFKTDLDLNHKLFQILKSKDAPDWWRIVLAYKAKSTTEDIYIDIRKNNTINVYYQGASIAKIAIRSGKIIATVHPKYLGYDDKSNKDHYTAKGDPIYQSCHDKLKELGNGKESILDCAKKFYSDKNAKEERDPEKKSEKKLQGEIVCRDKTRYIDSEFAHRYIENQKNTIRIDLVRVDGSKIQFVELKRIQDDRLLNSDGSEPEVTKQISEYKKFIRENKDDLLEYYKRVITIKRELGIPTTDANIESLTIDEEPYLEIYNLYKKPITHPARKSRIRKIQQHLDQAQIQYSINDPNNP